MLLGYFLVIALQFKMNFRSFWILGSDKFIYLNNDAMKACFKGIFFIWKLSHF